MENVSFVGVWWSVVELECGIVSYQIGAKGMRVGSWVMDTEVDTNRLLNI